MTLGRIDLVRLLIPSLQLGPPRPSLLIVRRTRPEALRRTIAAQAAATAPWGDMSLEEMLAPPATVDKPASREIKIPLADAATAVVAAMPNAVVVAVAAGIEAAKGKVDEEFRWRRMK